MPRSRKVGIRELKNNLSAYIREVRRGARILVADRETIVAELREPENPYGTALPVDPILADWVQRGIVIPATREKTPLPPSPVRLEEGTALRLLDETREEGHSE
jgi:hypothetical protein